MEATMWFHGSSWKLPMYQVPDLQWKPLPRKSTQKTNSVSSTYKFGARYRYARDRADMYSSRTGDVQRAGHSAPGGWATATGDKTQSGGISRLFVLRTVDLFFRPTTLLRSSGVVGIKCEPYLLVYTWYIFLYCRT